MSIPSFSATAVANARIQRSIPAASIVAVESAITLSSPSDVPVLSLAYTPQRSPGVRTGASQSRSMSSSSFSKVTEQPAISRLVM
ncbi:hypothetical protein GCM10009610_07100 [Pseudonocardia xinjiangensis]